MTTQLSEQEMYELAKKRVKAKRDFYTHLVVYVVINAILVILWWAVTGAGYPWFLWALGGWGVGLLFNFLGVFVLDKDTAWEKRQIEKEIEKMKKS